MKYFIKIIFFCLFAQFAKSQNVSSELAKTTRAYSSAANISMDIKVTMYSNKKDKIGRVLGQGIMRKSNENYYSKFYQQEVLNNKKGTFIIDHEDKSISFFNPQNTPYKNNAANFPKMDSLLASSDSVIYKGEVAGNKLYSIFTHNSYIIQSDLYIDKVNLFINKLVYYYKEADKEENSEAYKISVEYVNIKTTLIQEEVFSESRYITYSHSKLIVNSAYKNYKLLIADNEDK